MLLHPCSANPGFLCSCTAPCLPFSAHATSVGLNWIPATESGEFPPPNTMSAAIDRLIDRESAKPTNPKDAIGSDKIPFHLWPETATILGALGCLDGACKYGRSNYREIGVRASIYIDAAKRHLNAWFEGEECAEDSDVPHLGHALACIAIVVDAQAAGKLNDDRQLPGGYKALLEAMTPLVKTIKTRHEGKTPKHYTIADTHAP